MELLELLGEFLALEAFELGDHLGVPLGALRRAFGGHAFAFGRTLVRAFGVPFGEPLDHGIAVEAFELGDHLAVAFTLLAAAGPVGSRGGRSLLRTLGEGGEGEGGAGQGGGRTQQGPPPAPRCRSHRGLSCRERRFGWGARELAATLITASVPTLSAG